MEHLRSLRQLSAQRANGECKCFERDWWREEPRRKPTIPTQLTRKASEGRADGGRRLMRRPERVTRIRVAALREPTEMLGCARKMVAGELAAKMRLGRHSRSDTRAPAKIRSATATGRRRSLLQPGVMRHHPTDALGDKPPGAARRGTARLGSHARVATYVPTLTSILALNFACSRCFAAASHMKGGPLRHGKW